jgi:hypothetical protein
MNFSRRLFFLLGLFFSTMVVAKIVHSYKPVWDWYTNIAYAVIILAIGLLTLKEFVRPSPAVLALREAERQLQEAERQLAFQLEEERRLQRNARRREQRAAQRTAAAKRATAKAPPVPPAKEAPGPVKSRWDRLLEDDEE